MVALKKMVTTVSLGAGGSQKYYFLSNPALYTSIGTIVGIALAPTSDSQVVHRVEDLLLYGILETLIAHTGTTPTNKKTARILCAADKTVTAEQELIQKTIPQGVITSISAGLKAQDYLS